MNSVFIFYTSYDTILQELNKCELLKRFEKYKKLIAQCFHDKSQYGIDEGSVNYLVGAYVDDIINEFKNDKSINKHKLIKQILLALNKCERERKQMGVSFTKNICK